MIKKRPKEIINEERKIIFLIGDFTIAITVNLLIGCNI